ncbi:MAG: biotin--[acetyl-CoA-carboxylase] ligase [Clostridiaceae bacterium]|jgi:BirA family transcriptional regulator, biotin operon repressor / biotin---[acetyl-CoA-carboxylase] ligase|nr:biotin--[acetyl-CoA-carboxylase] ligase [Clostridiaceae bacterium]
MDKIYFEYLDSTNEYAKERFDDIEDKTIVVAEHQISGHGRYNRKWLDLGDENLYMSFVLKPSNDIKRCYANLTQYLSVIICKVLDDYGIDTVIKWPNDVLVNNKKIAGILCESVLKRRSFKGLVLGTGINLNVKSDKLDMVSDRKVTALNLETGENINKSLFLETLCEKFFENYDDFLENGFSAISKIYRKKMLKSGSPITIKGFNTMVTGFVVGINDYGELLLNSGGNVITLNYGDII